MKVRRIPIMTFGNKIQKLRKERGLSQDALAELLCVSRQAISKWELGEAMPDISNAIQLSQFFHV
ncbi:MAG: helix-turn-helix transcriptional regulator, partial [Gemmiger sp.]|uniref:helix-turn-helix transcriptional regulator n=1 Tax=Gemmiger sp. TaxID=2049027 RepID=UPI002A90A408